MTIKRFALYGAATLTALTLASCSGDDEEAAPSTVTVTDEVTVTRTTTVTNTPEPEPSETADPEPAAVPSTFRDGTHAVGTDIQPGTYRSSGSDMCYWERLSGFGGQLEDIIANENPSGQAIVTIAPTDVAFKSQRCGTWEMIQ